MKKRLLSVVLSAAMAFVGIGAGVWEPVTVYAEETGESNGETEVKLEDNETEVTDDSNNEGTAEDPEFCGIFIDENGDLNPWLEESGNDNDRYFKIIGNGAEAKVQDVTPEDEGADAPDEYNFYYDKGSYTLTLKDMNVSIDAETVITSEYGKKEGQVLKINLIGDNKLETTDKSFEAIYLNGSTIITGGSLTVTGGAVETEESETFCPAAISVGSGCAIFTNGATITTNVSSAGAIGFSAWDLASGSDSYKDETGETHTATGHIINFGTITGKIGLFDGECTNLVSCRTNAYPNPPSDHTYIGKAYYFMDEELYPNNIQGTLNPGDWRIVGKYDENGNPRPSKVFYQWIYKDCEGSVYTEDRVDPIEYLVYQEDATALGNGKKIEDLLEPDDVAAVNDGETHTFNTDLYAVWFTKGNVTVNGDVTLDVACSSAPEESWQSAEALSGELKSWDTLKEWNDADNKEACFLQPELGENEKPATDEEGKQVPLYGHYGEETGAVCYKKDSDGNVQFQDSSTSSITINGSTGFLSLSDSYQGSVTVRDDINFCATYAEKEFLKKWIYRLQWQFDGSPYRPAETYYCAVPKGGEVVKNGEFTETVKKLAFADGVKLAGSGLYDGTYFAQTEMLADVPENKGGKSEAVAGTSAVVNDNSLLVNVSQKSGLEKDTYPLVRQADASAEQKITSHLANRANMVAMDIAMIQQVKEKVDGEEKVKEQKEVEPNGKVNLYFDRIDLSKLKNPALFHIKDDGNVEKISIVTSGATTTSASVKCETNSFSTYVFAEDQTIINPTPSKPSGGSTTDNPGGGTSSGGTNTGSASGGTSSSGATSKPTTETKPDGTKVETSTDTKADGTKVDTTVETKTDGTKTETVVETAKDGSVKTTEIVTKADGSATKTEKETEKNTKGKEVAVTTTTEKDASGKVTGITQTSEIAKIAGSASATVTVEKTADGKITSAEAEVDKKGASSKQGVTATLFGSVVSQITEAAGTQAVEISMTVTAGKKEYTVKADAQDLEAGNKLKVLAIDEKTGKHVLVNAKTYTVGASGNVKLTLPAGMTYQLMDSKEAAAVEKQILATVKVKKASATVTAGKKTTVQMSKKLDMDNVAKITYSTSKKSVATVSKDGQVTAKKAGAVVITAKVTLKNGKTKNVKMKITVE